MTDEQLTNKERYELRRQEKDEIRESSAQKRMVKKYLMLAGVLLVVFAVIYGVYILSKSSEPEGEDFSRAIPDMGRNHITDGSVPSVAYNSNPPTSGEHYGTPARPGFRESVIADGNLIHSLEHGLVWVSYHPRIGEEADKLRDITSPLVVVTPREANDADIAVASWGRLDTFNLEDGIIDDDDLQRINDFVKRYANKAPERIPPGQHGGI
ncbi:MAG: DUF3105 domain-containing protein [Candidatus Yanofskybacteria bacterium]|nr:DUF3105 domain-containing protein [Candidatus Yanofskybacteria bacterium]